MTDDWIQHRTETCQRGNVCVPHMVLSTDLGYLALGNFMWKASSLFMSAASRVQVPLAYVKTQDWHQDKSLENLDFGRQRQVPIAQNSSYMGRSKPGMRAIVSSIASVICGSVTSAEI